MADDTRTRSEVVYAQLRSDILTGRLGPGARLRFADLTRRYEVSSGVLREVLPRLVEQGLLMSQPQIGFSVVSPSDEDLQELVEARVLLESSVLELSMKKGDLAWESQLLAAYHVMDRTEPFGDDGEVSEEWQQAHVNFHHYLLAGCANKRLLDTVARLRDTTEVYRFSSIGLRAGIDVRSEHRELFQATLDRRTEDAQASLVRHLEHVTAMFHSDDADEADAAEGPQAR